MERRYLLPLVVLVLVISGSAWSLPLNGYNEVQNPGFETGTLAYWQAGADILVAQDGPGHLWAATCKSSGVDVWLRQIVDDSDSPEWNWDYHNKLLDVCADITWSGLEFPSQSGIKFRVDWWGEEWNTTTDPTLLPYYEGPPPGTSDPAQGYYVNDWVTAWFGTTPVGQWTTVNPFDQILVPIQPRWVSVEIEFIQAPGEAVWVDNVWVTGECVPEPGSILAMLAGIGSLLGSARYLRRR